MISLSLDYRVLFEIVFKSGGGSITSSQEGVKLLVEQKRKREFSGGPCRGICLKICSEISHLDASHVGSAAQGCFSMGGRGGWFLGASLWNSIELFLFPLFIFSSTFLRLRKVCQPSFLAVSSGFLWWFPMVVLLLAPRP